MELPFSADLLDAVGSPTNISQLRLIEVSGRLISGFAAALFVWALWIIPACGHRGTSVFKAMVICIVIGLPCMAVVYWMEHVIVNAVVASSTVSERKDAVFTVLFAHQIENGQTAVRGLDLDNSVLASAQGKTLVALFPFITSALPGIKGKLSAAVPDWIKDDLLVATGGPVGSYDKIYVPSVHKLATDYVKYRTGVERYHHARQEVPGRAALAYRKYREALAKHFSGPPPQWMWKSIRRKVRAAGVPVPGNWNGWNPDVFIRAAIRHGNNVIETKFTSDTARVAGAPLPMTIESFNAFLANSVIQNRWREDLHLPSGVKLNAHLTPKEWTNKIYDPSIDREVRLQMRMFEAPPGAYSRNGDYYHVGEQAIRALVIPPLALIFSLIGTFGHLMKTSVTTCYVLQPRFTRWPKLVALLVALLLSLAPILVPTTLTRSPVYGAIHEGIADNDGWFTADAITWMIQTEAIVYPWNSKLRGWITPYFSVRNSWIAKALAHS